MEIIKKAQVQEIIRRANQVVINPGLQRGGGGEKKKLLTLQDLSFPDSL